MPTQASALLDTLMRVQIIGHQQEGSVEIFHLRWPGINGLDYITLDEALEARWIEVTEFTEAGQVPRVKIINRSGHMVFVMAGEQLVGCKQNRVVERQHHGSLAQRDAAPSDLRETRPLGI